MSWKRAALAAVSATVALVALALVVAFDAPGLGRDLEQRVRSAMGLEFTVAGARVRLLGELVLEDVRFSAGGYRAHVPRVILDQRPFAVLRPEGIRFESGRIDSGAGDVSIEGFELVLTEMSHDPRAVTGLHGLRMDGVLSVEKIGFASRELRNLAARIVIDNGRARLEDLEVALAPGALSGNAVLDFNSLPFRYRASLEGASFAVGGTKGGLHLEAEGFGTRARNLGGRGTFALEPGRFPDAAWVSDIDPELAGSEHGPVEIDFELRQERIYFEKIAVAGFELEGSVGFDGSREVRVVARP